MNTQRDAGSITVMLALLLPVILAMSALVMDMGLIYGNRRALQNAADAAALAAAVELRNESLGALGDPAGEAQIFAARNGISGSGGVCTADGKATLVVNAPGPATTPQSWQITVSRLVPLTFGAALGIKSECVTAHAVASASPPVTDIMLSLDTTGSMTLSGPHDFDELRQAVVDFVNQINPDPSNQRTSRLGMARFAGIKCDYDPSGRYVAPCVDDKTLLSPLTDNKSTLLTIATGNGVCPAGVSPYGCPLEHVPYIAPHAQYCATSWMCPYYTGTKLPNGFSVLNTSGFYAWDPANGGRANAHKVMVLITDGQNEESPPGNFPESVSGYDNQARSLAQTLRAGPDGQSGTADDVEVYVVGYFCVPYVANQEPPQTFCKSSLAPTRACPSATWPPQGTTPSAIDVLLHDLSSSSPGSCDHYYALAKSDSLPQLMQTIAGRLAKVRLTQ